jgi:hypothetical protein
LSVGFSLARDLIRWGVLNTLKVLLDSTLILLADEREPKPKGKGKGGKGGGSPRGGSGGGGSGGCGGGVFRVLAQGGAGLSSRRMRKLHAQLLHMLWLEAQDMETAESLPGQSLRGDGGGVSGRPLLEVYPFDIKSSSLLPSASAEIENQAMKLMPTEEFYLVRRYCTQYRRSSRT